MAGCVGEVEPALVSWVHCMNEHCLNDGGDVQKGWVRRRSSTSQQMEWDSWLLQQAQTDCDCLVMHYQIVLAVTGGVGSR